MSSRRLVVLVVGAALAVVVTLLGPAVASAEEVSNPPSTECNPDGRAICIDVNTFQAITASDLPTPSNPTPRTRYTWVEWRMYNQPGATATLTHPSVNVTLADYDCSAVPEEEEVSDPETDPDCDLLARTSAFVGTVDVSPNLCTVSPGSVSCQYANIPSGGTAPEQRIFFRTANLPATHTVISVEGIVKERDSDQTCPAGDANCDTFETFVVNSYEPKEGEAETFTRQDESFYLDTDDTLGVFGDGASSFTFTSGSPANFRANFKSDTGGCAVAGAPVTPTCFQRTLALTTADGAPAAYNSGAVLFYARLTNVPSGKNQNNIIATHTYDSVEVTAASDVFTPEAGYSFAGITKVNIDGTDYFVVNYNSTTNTFQLSSTGGPPLATFLDGLYEATPAPQIIGDVSAERWTSPGLGGCTFTPTGTPVVPSICVKKVNGLQNTFDAWVRDSRNGLIKMG